jgi:ADP-ribosylation factor GTPase-activating protein 1
MDQKAQNEGERLIIVMRQITELHRLAYFEGLGNLNASRPDDLPPSQGGRYQGFGSTPSPDPRSSDAAFGLSSRAAPSLTDFQQDPVAALGKGWSLFSSVVASASRTVNESIIQPGMERVLDPEFQANVKGYASEAGKKVTQVGSAANEWGKSSLGVDVAGQVTDVAGQLGWSNRSTAGYGALPQNHDSAYQDDDEDDFFGNFESSDSHHDAPSAGANSSTSASASGAKKDGHEVCFS